jgi:hypothetical protein
MSYEFSQNPDDNFEQHFLGAVNQINDWVSGRNQRGSHAETTERKLVPKLAALTQEFRDTAAYIRTPLVLLPMEDGSLGVGIGETTGEIVGFQYGDYPTFSETFEEGPVEQGVIAIIATGSSNTEGLTPASWDKVIPEETRVRLGGSDDYKKKGVVPVLIPITQHTRLTKVDNSVPLNFNPSQLFSFESTNNRPVDYREYVARIESLMNGKYLGTRGTDGALMAALHKELAAMNRDYPHLGQSVEVSASYMRTPSQINKGSFTIVDGTITGILRKFIYEPYFPGPSKPHMKARGTVQAVIYPPEIAQLVYSGQLSAQEADKIPGTVFVPLDQEHSLSPVN